MHKLRAVAVFGALSLTLACGGGSGSGGSGGGGGGGGVSGCTTGTGSSASGNAIAASAPNVAIITVDGGLPNNPYVNGVFTTVTVCKHGIKPPSTGNCQNIDHVLVDTGSYGLRLLSNNGGGALTLALPAEPDPSGSGNVLAECAQFSDGITWGPLKMADIYIGGATAGSGESAISVPGTASNGMPVQIIADPGFATVPSACTSFGTPENSLSTLLANGIVGIGPFPQDCGDGCNLSTALGNPGLYYSCPSTGCSSSSQPTAVAVDFQVWNPVAAFTALTTGATANNNGDIMELPSVPATGLAVVNGSLVFGIGTQSNNGLGGAKVYTGDSSANITTTFAGDNFGGNNSFIDSGSNGYFFNFPSANVANCQGSSGFYCPVSGTNPITLACSATNTGQNNQSGSINFNVANLDALPGSSAAFNNIAGANTPPPGSKGTTGFDWGLPFFFGRNVYTGMSPVAGVTSTPPGVPAGPFYAY